MERRIGWSCKLVHCKRHDVQQSESHQTGQDRQDPVGNSLGISTEVVCLGPGVGEEATVLGYVFDLEGSIC